MDGSLDSCEAHAVSSSLSSLFLRTTAACFSWKRHNSTVRMITHQDAAQPLSYAFSSDKADDSPSLVGAPSWPPGGLHGSP